jgi:hypothetical protein
VCWNEVCYIIFPVIVQKLLMLTCFSLAKAEMRLALATVIRRYDSQELFETTRADVDIKHDLFLPQADFASKGVRILFK